MGDLASGFALLRAATQWVFGEVQLLGAGCATSAQLEAFSRKEMDAKEGMLASKGEKSSEKKLDAELKKCLEQGKLTSLCCLRVLYVL